MTTYTFRNAALATLCCFAAALTGCATTPLGPTVNVLPGANEPFQVFQQDQVNCKSYAQQQVAGQADQANQRAVGGAVLSSALGAAIGGAFGGGHGAGAGAAVGAGAGAAGGANDANTQQVSIQQQYDNAYTQCMYSKGAQIPAAVVAPGPGADQQ